MGQTFSTGGTGTMTRVPEFRRSKCSKIPQYVDRRAWVLKELYKVKDINEFPPQKYSLADAEADIKACVGGYRLPSSWKVTSVKKVESMKGQDLRAYALKKYHGYGPNEVTTRTIALLPYSKEDAVTDYKYYKKYGQPYFIIDRLQSTVRSRDGKISRAPGQKGTSLNYKYDVAQMDKKGKFAAKKKYDVTQYPLQTMKDGSVGRVIPCSVDPSMCKQGMTTFVSRNVSNILKRAAQINAKSKKQNLRMAQTTHARKIAALNKKIASAPPELKQKLQKQRENMQRNFRLKVARTEQTGRIQIGNSKSAEWKQKRAELGRQKQLKKQAEILLKKKEEAERRAAAERKKIENNALRKMRQQKKNPPSPETQAKLSAQRKEADARKMSAQQKEADARKMSAERAEAEKRKLSVIRKEAERRKLSAQRKEADARKMSAQQKEADARKLSAERKAKEAAARQLSAQRKANELLKTKMSAQRKEAEKLSAQRRENERKRLSAQRRAQETAARQLSAQRKANNLLKKQLSAQRKETARRQQRAREAEARHVSAQRKARNVQARQLSAKRRANASAKRRQAPSRLMPNFVTGSYSPSMPYSPIRPGLKSVPPFGG
ncbi:hypothetical protein ATCV1_Z092L [Acanthocystis turfacea chlorella virus 1]|uniref:Uncharacterized protein Z092L n=1 Tax=Chlorovirus heliozoae TaxID=322019 RepID=A7K852_9PHYC|nr:hypothetical protein ATCV1_Z092L [Acanthocystis turfacea chlorella virus 1]ABT16226.1 hypothetical protein ATCV1_Z092L [Acanthocystis turfacea chlorella virus 1]